MGSHLTLATVADEVGCTGQALNKRLGAKRGRLLAFADSLNALCVEGYEWAQADRGSPLKARYDRLLTPATVQPDELLDASTLANSLTFRLESIADEEFRARWEKRDRMLANQLAQSIAAAQAAGELAPSADPQALGETIHMALAGAALVTARRRDEAVGDRFRTILDAVLGPHRTGG